MKINSYPTCAMPFSCAPCAVSPEACIERALELPPGSVIPLERRFIVADPLRFAVLFLV